MGHFLGPACLSLRIVCKARQLAETTITWTDEHECLLRYTNVIGVGELRCLAVAGISSSIFHSTGLRLYFPSSELSHPRGIYVHLSSFPEAVTRFYRPAYNINRHLSRYFPDPLEFCSLQARTGLDISGSNALQFLDRSFYPKSDLDLYAHPGHVYEAMEWLEFVGYNFEPDSNQDQDEDWHNEVSAEWDDTARRMDRNDLGDPTWYPQIAAVYTFEQNVAADKENMELKVQIIHILGSTLKFQGSGRRAVYILYRARAHASVVR
ncbi:uncharacterized protein EDB91DRAFT_1332401 [Suillus paluster]|uniref:uncharacterized protein n=1 Tax=Suillus paluster TaxID=48578 RepID=UPI001B875748|nr:uncharacterized protein EDB91DRAFT_1332401 [Suillus paluster]KAG1756597.1 hypothetical protein EDB91DRAFT_1332401 [Suillus paluster]